jgi:Leucine-rich repeat (LRR) protein
LPTEIGNLTSLQFITLSNNKFKSLQDEILKIKEKVGIDNTSYDINNLDINCEILLFSLLNEHLLNLPSNLKEIWLKKKDVNVKLPFNCNLCYY